MGTALITGCSSGFGYLIARTLANNGYTVFASMRQMDGRNAAAAEELRTWAQVHNARLELVELDVDSDDSVQSAVEHVLAKGRGIDVVINNALLPTMRTQRSGLIVWITSTLGRILPSIGGLYPATKCAAEGFAESLHYQLKPFGVDVVILEPGSFPTPATWKGVQPQKSTIVADYEAAAPTNSVPPARPSPDYKPPDPQEVADAVQHLVDMPPGQRPLRLVVGPVFTEGVADYNETYLQVRSNLERSLQRPDQAITWTPEVASSRS